MRLSLRLIQPTANVSNSPFIDSRVFNIELFKFLGEIEHALNLSKPKIVFASPTTIDKVLSVTAKRSSIEAVIVFGETNGISDPKVIEFKTFCSNVNASNNFECEPQDVLENVSLILCSSGTTGGLGKTTNF